MATIAKNLFVFAVIYYLLFSKGATPQKKQSSNAAMDVQNMLDTMTGVDPIQLSEETQEILDKFDQYSNALGFGHYVVCSVD